MRQLYLLRHAKSDWHAGIADDHDRPLNERGLQAARRLGRFLADLQQIPDAVLTSSAVRAETTVRLAAEAGGWTSRIRVTKAFYTGGPAEVLAEARREPAATQSLLLAGHEPVWSTLVGQLIGSARVRMVTAALARIDFEIDTWQALESGRGTLVWLVAPKLLPGGE